MTILNEEFIKELCEIIDDRIEIKLKESTENDIKMIVETIIDKLDIIIAKKIKEHVKAIAIHLNNLE